MGVEYIELGVLARCYSGFECNYTMTATHTHIRTCWRRTFNDPCVLANLMVISTALKND